MEKLQKDTDDLDKAEIKSLQKEKKNNAKWQNTKHRWGFGALQTYLHGRGVKSSGIRSGSWRKTLLQEENQVYRKRMMSLEGSVREIGNKSRK